MASMRSGETLLTASRLSLRHRSFHLPSSSSHRSIVVLPIPHTSRYTSFRSISSSSSHSDSYRPPVYPEADIPLGYVEENRSERLDRAKFGFKLFAKYCAWGFTLLGVVSYSVFEGSHYYVEHYKLPRALRSSSSSSSSAATAGGSADEDWYGWDEEIQSWTGGPRGGTSPRLGYRARHALRAAWMAQHWGEEDPGTQEAATKQSIFEPDHLLLKRLEKAEQRSRLNRINLDRAFVLADGYISTALELARRKGMEFPPELSLTRPAGPPSTPSSLGDSTSRALATDEPGNVRQEASSGSSTAMTSGGGDPVVLDLLMLKAGNYEKMGKTSALVDAKEIYERIACSTGFEGSSSPTTIGQAMRLSKKIGDLCQRIGAADEAIQWYNWGLGRNGIKLEEMRHKRGSSWFGGKGSSSSSSSSKTSGPSTVSPALLRATMSLLIAAEVHYARTGRLDDAWNIQSASLSLLPPSSPRSPLDSSSAVTKDNASALLHEQWVQSRRTMLNLHQAAVAHALKKKASANELADKAAFESERALPLIDPLPAVYTSTAQSPLYEPSRALHRDALLLAAEASFTRGRLLETKWQPPLPVIAECFKRAAELDAQESGKTEESAMGNEWHKYWRNYVRIKDEMGESVEDPFAVPERSREGRPMWLRGVDDAFGSVSKALGIGAGKR